MAKKVFVLGAAGRIGRGVTHELVDWIQEQKGFQEVGLSKSTQSLELVGLGDIVPLEALIDNYRGRDPVHGIYQWKVEKIDASKISLKGQEMKYFCEKDVSKLPLKELGIDILLECTGLFGDPKGVDKPNREQNLSRRFLEYGVKTVIQTYPAKTADIMIIMGVNHDLYNPEVHKIVSNASCTTKSLAVPLQVMIDNGMGIADCRMVTVHAATASQKVLESLGQIVTHSTGAAKATGEVIPSLKGAMGGTSARVPTLDGSVSYMTLMVYAKDLTAESLNDLFRANVQNQRYEGRLGIIEGESITSADIVNRRENALIIPFETQVSKPFPSDKGKNLYHVFLASGYDNELGSAVDPVLLADHIARKSS